MLSRVGVVAFLLAFGFSFLPAKAEAARSVAFKANSFSFTAPIDKEFKLDMKTLLSDQGSGNLVWTLGPTTPAWIKINSPTNILSGTPAASDLGKSSFRLSVLDGDTGALTQIEMNVIGPPTWKQQNIDLGIQNEDFPMTPFDLAKHVDNPAGGTLTFSSPNLGQLAPWMTLTAAGVLTGTPRRANVGIYKDIIFIAKGPGGDAQANAFGEVKKTIHEPNWKANPITLPDALEDALYDQQLVGRVDNPEGTALVFSKVSGPNWVQINPDGRLFGTPKKGDIGPVTITANFKTTVDTTNFSKNTVLKFNVIHVNHAPTWTANPLRLPDAFTKVLYNQSLIASVKDIDDNETFTFQKLSGPVWASISTDGKISGTPQIPDIGMNSFLVKVTDSGGLSAETTVQVMVIRTNEPPKWKNKPTVLPVAKEDQNYMVDLVAYADDPDGDPLFFTIVSGPSWAKLSGTTLTGTPKAPDIGISKYVIRVSDNKSGNDVSDVLIEVEHVNHAPEWILNPIHLTVKEKQPMNQSIAQWAKDQDVGDKLSFQLLAGGPEWAKLSIDGTFTGTPPATAIGDNVYNVRVSDQLAAFADVKVIITVQNVNDKPYWTQDPITLPNAKEDNFYNASLAEFAKDPDNDPLVFTKVSGPAWIMVSSTGDVTGTPRRADVGLNTFQVRITDPGNESAVATVRITVDKTNHAPRWRQDPILMPDAKEDHMYSFNLVPYAVDDDGDALTFSLVSGPKWMSVSAAGMVSGMPKKDDIGDFTAVFRVSDGTLTADATGKGKVVPANHAPVIDPEFPTFIVKERGELKISLTTYVTDPDGDKITFSFTNLPNWITAFSNGDVTFRPLHEHLGDHAFPFTATDEVGLSTSGTLKVKVIRDPRPPVCQNPIVMEGIANEVFNNSLAGKCTDPDNYPLTYKKDTGKAWLTVEPAGRLSGLPKDADIGDNTFGVSACNEYVCAPTTLIIKIKQGVVKDQVQVDTDVPGAPVENLWTVDTSDNCSSLTLALRNNIKYYYNALNAKQVHHTGVYLSADPRLPPNGWDGKPVAKPGQSPLFKWDSPNIVQDFLSRMDTADRGNEDERDIAGRGWSDLNDDGRCSNCFNSPIWSMFRFYERVKSMPEYHNGYMMSGVPMDVMIVTQQLDHYKYFTQGTPQKDWKATDFAESFIVFHQKEKKAYRINVIAPECPYLITENAAWAAPANSYSTLSSKTGGKYYLADNCAFNMRVALEDYAKRVIQRAMIHAKNRIKLSKTPINPAEIKVSIGGVPLAPSQWKYEVVDGVSYVILYWDLIDQGQIKPGDMIVIEYRVS